MIDNMMHGQFNVKQKMTVIPHHHWVPCIMSQGDYFEADIYDQKVSIVMEEEIQSGNSLITPCSLKVRVSCALSMHPCYK